MWAFFSPNVQKLKARRNVPGLIKALRWKRDDFLHGQAACALGEVGDARAIEPLIHLYNLDEYNSSDEAAQALVQIAKRLADPEITSRLVELFISALKSEGFVYSGRRIHYDGDDDEFNREWARGEESRLRQEGWWNDGASHRASAARALGMLRDPRAVEALSKCLKTHRSAYDGNTRLAAVTALGEIGDPAAIPALREALQDYPEEIRALATEALARLSLSSR